MLAIPSPHEFFNVGIRIIAEIVFTEKQRTVKRIGADFFSDSPACFGPSGSRGSGGLPFDLSAAGQPASLAETDGLVRLRERDKIGFKPELPDLKFSVS